MKQGQYHPKCGILTAEFKILAMKIQDQLNVLTKILENYQKTTVTPPPTHNDVK